jgi:hypothetical protein
MATGTVCGSVRLKNGFQAKNGTKIVFSHKVSFSIAKYRALTAIVHG